MPEHDDQSERDERRRRSDPAQYGEDEAFSEDFRRTMRRVFAPLNWLRRR